MGGARIVDCWLSDTGGGGQWVVVGVGGDQRIGLCCGGGWQWRGICRRYAEMVIVGTWGHVRWASGGG